MNDDRTAGGLEIATIVAIADRFGRTVHALEGIVTKRGAVWIDRFDDGQWRILMQGGLEARGRSLGEALQSAQRIMMEETMERMDVGGAKIGECVTCKTRRQLTKNGFCDECCPTGDCEVPVVEGADPSDRRSLTPRPLSTWEKFKNWLAK